MLSITYTRARHGGRPRNRSTRRLEEAVVQYMSAATHPIEDGQNGLLPHSDLPSRLGSAGLALVAYKSASFASRGAVSPQLCKEGRHSPGLPA